MYFFFFLRASQSRAVATVSNAVAIDSESEDSEKCNSRKTRRTGGLDAKQTESYLEDCSESHNEENETNPEESGSDEESSSPQNEQPETVGIKFGNGEQDTENECSTSDESSQDEEDSENVQTDVEGKESSLEDGDAHPQDIAKTISEEDTEADETNESEDEDQTGHENVELILSQGKAEDICKENEDKVDMQGSIQEKEQSKNNGDGLDDSDLEDCIISPQSR